MSADKIDHAALRTTERLREAVVQTRRANEALEALDEIRPRLMAAIARADAADAKLAQIQRDDRSVIERFADSAAAQFQSALDYDGAEVKRRILMTALKTGEA